MDDHGWHGFQDSLDAHGTGQYVLLRPCSQAPGRMAASAGAAERLTPFPVQDYRPKPLDVEAKSLFIQLNDW